LAKTVEISKAALDCQKMGDATIVVCRYLISGRVQGVGFRRFAQARASAWGLTGWVRNLRDGRVEALAAGAEPAQADLKRELAQGPPGSRVAGVDVARVNLDRAGAKSAQAEDWLGPGFACAEDGEGPCSIN
jgi:acylphosphatase